MWVLRTSCAVQTAMLLASLVFAEDRARAEAAPQYDDEVSILEEPAESVEECAPKCDPECPPTWKIPTVCPTGFVAGAEYLLLRPSFSNNTALYQATATGGNSIALSSVNYDFGFASGVRSFIGYQFAADTLVRFSYLMVDASTTAFGQASGNYLGGDGTAYIGPFHTQAVPNSAFIRSTAEVDLDLYDLEAARRFEIDIEANGAARWDTAASAGIRFADTSVTSTVDNYCPLCPNYLVGTNRSFHGVGPRIAAQGRRYLGPSRRWSIYANGGAALLIGNYKNFDSRLTKGANLYESQQTNGTLVVPNLDISLGAGWQMTDRTAFSAGWMLMYFGHLGYSETIDTNGVGEGAIATSVPLTNSSLAYDGFFLRLTHCF